MKGKRKEGEAKGRGGEAARREGGRGPDGGSGGGYRKRQWQWWSGRVKGEKVREERVKAAEIEK